MGRVKRIGSYRLCEQRRFRRACASAQSRQNLRYSLIQAVSQEEPSDRKPDPYPLWMAGHAQLKFVMTECSKTQIRLTRSIYNWTFRIRVNSKSKIVPKYYVATVMTVCWKKMVLKETNWKIIFSMFIHYLHDSIVLLCYLKCLKCVLSISMQEKQRLIISSIWMALTIKSFIKQTWQGPSGKT